MTSNEKYFTWSDAWIFASLRGAIDEQGFQFSSFLGAADTLNHAIPTPEEIKQGFARLHARGLIEIEKENIRTTELAAALYAKIQKRRGGLFSVVDNSLAVLNSPRTKLPYIDKLPDVDLITPDYMRKRYEEYDAWVQSALGRHSR